MAQTLLAWFGNNTCTNHQQVKLFSKLGGSFLGSIREQTPDETQKDFFKRVKKHVARLVPHHLGFTWRSVDLEVVDQKVLVGWSTTKALKRVAKQHCTDVYGYDADYLFLKILSSCRKVVEEVRAYQSVGYCSISGGSEEFTDLSALSGLPSLWRLGLSSGDFDLQGITTSSIDELDLRWARVTNFLSLPTTLKVIHAKHVQNDDLSFQDVVCRFTLLESLVLKDTCLNGFIQSELGRLNLTTLKVVGNNLESTIPSSIGITTTLRTLNLSANRLVGAIPSELLSLPNLQNLKLSCNQLTGKIFAPSFGENLLTLNLSANQLEGELPLGLNLATSLEDVNLSNNHFVGAIPSGLLSLPSLKSLNLAANCLSGQVPTLLGPRLVFLDLRRNRLSGRIPTFEEGPLLELLVLKRNYLTGCIPSELASLKCLDFVDLSYNLLSGTIPTELGQLRGTSLYASHNRLSGAFPPHLLLNCEVLDLSHNRLRGGLPSELYNLKRAMTIDLSNNQLSGIFPSELTKVLNLKLNLNFNFLSGKTL